MSNFAKGNYLIESITVPKDVSERDFFLKRQLEDITTMVNRKDTGQYETVEVQCNQTFPASATNKKQYVFRKVFPFGAIATGATLNIAHGLTISNITRLYGTAVTATSFHPLPYVSVTNITDQVELVITGANIVIVSGATFPNITSGYIVLEYLK